MNSTVKNIIFWVVMAVTALLIWAVVKSSTGDKIQDLTFTQFINEVDKDKVQDDNSFQLSRTLQGPAGEEC